jgi:hypothetical protein
MFALGLEFSIRKLKKVGHVIFPTAVLDMAIMIWAGHFVGTKILGWGSLQSLFLGAAISDSATTLLAKTISEMGWGTRRFTKYIFGITITEDILCIGVIAVLTGLVNSGAMHTGELLASMGGLTLFMTGVTVFGLLLVPRVMNRVGKLKDDESLLLTMLGFCFLVSFIADKLNFSLALGAFLVGVMGAESGLPVVDPNEMKGVTLPKSTIVTQDNPMWQGSYDGEVCDLFQSEGHSSGPPGPEPIEDISSKSFLSGGGRITILPARPSKRSRGSLMLRCCRRTRRWRRSSGTTRTPSGWRTRS